MLVSEAMWASKEPKAGVIDASGCAPQDAMRMERFFIIVAMKHLGTFPVSFAMRASIPPEHFIILIENGDCHQISCILGLLSVFENMCEKLNNIIFYDGYHIGIIRLYMIKEDILEFERAICIFAKGTHLV